MAAHNDLTMPLGHLDGQPSIPRERACPPDGTTPTVAVGRYDLLHLLLSVAPGARPPGDEAALGAVMARVAALLAAGEERPWRVDAPPPALIMGWGLWVARANCWLVAPTGPGGDCVIVDAPPGAADVVAPVLRRHRLTPVAVALTHGHADHTGGVAALLRAVGDVPVFVHPGDRLRAEDPVAARDVLGRVLDDPRPVPPGAARDLRPGPLPWRGMEGRVLYTPGHTVGSVSVYFRVLGRQYLLTGDHLLAGGVGRTDVPGADHDLMARSHRLLAGLDDAVVVLPGHGRPTTLGEERRTNPYVSRPVATADRALRPFAPVA